MRLLVISRKYPPSVGGMQEYTYQLIRHLDQKDTIYWIAHEIPRPLLPVFFVYAFAKSWVCIRRNAVQLIHLHDGVLAPLGLALKLATRKPVVITIHGIDIMYPNRIYQRIIPFCVRRLDKVFCNSHATKTEGVKRGVHEERLCVIPVGISDEFHQPADKVFLRQQLARQYGIPFDKKLLLSVGRLVKLKGIHWFISEVMPKVLDKRNDVVYLVGGQGPLEETLRRLIQEKKLSRHVRLLEKIPDKSALGRLYHAADLFVMPNIPIKEDMEGFGIVALEAASCGLPVVATRLDGIQDAIKHGKNGFLVEPLNSTQFAETILSHLEHSEQLASQVRQYTLKHYAWEQIVEEYRRQFAQIASSC